MPENKRAARQLLRLSFHSRNFLTELLEFVRGKKIIKKTDEEQNKKGKT